MTKTHCITFTVADMRLGVADDQLEFILGGEVVYSLDLTEAARAAVVEYKKAAAAAAACPVDYKSPEFKINSEAYRLADLEAEAGEGLRLEVCKILEEEDPEIGIRQLAG